MFAVEYFIKAKQQGAGRLRGKTESHCIDPGTRTVHATKFHTVLTRVIDKYRDELKARPLTDEIWTHFTTKMKATIDNCEPYMCQIVQMPTPSVRGQ